jgi:hypothetical protein
MGGGNNGGGGYVYRRHPRNGSYYRVDRFSGAQAVKPGRMSRDRPESLTRITRCVVAAAACGFGLLDQVAANPPLRIEKTVLAAVPTERPDNPSMAQLDLRLPMNYSAAKGDSAGSTHSPAPSFRRSDTDTNGRVFAPDSSTDDPGFRMLSPSAIFVSRVRREGLPFARLWESKSALLSIGLNRKGKPGLWLTQKIR